MAETAANGLRFHVQVLRRADRPPDRPKVAMVHGLAGDMSSFYMTIATRVAVEADVHLYDLRGHGRSEIPLHGYTVADHVADLLALLDAWDLGEPVHLFGYSFGGIVALFFAHYHPERVASLFLIEPHLSGEGWGQHMAATIRALGDDPTELKEWIGTNPARIRRTRRAEDMFRTTSILDDLVTEPGLPTEWLEELRCPVFSIYGSDSDVVHQAVARDQRIPGCQPCIVRGGTHHLLAEENVIVRDHAVAWIRHHDPAGAAPRG